MSKTESTAAYLGRFTGYLLILGFCLLVWAWVIAGIIAAVRYIF